VDDSVVYPPVRAGSFAVVDVVEGRTRYLCDDSDRGEVVAGGEELVEPATGRVGGDHRDAAVTVGPVVAPVPVPLVEGVGAAALLAAAALHVVAA
jgi:hypothetical protein